MTPRQQQVLNAVIKVSLRGEWYRAQGSGERVTLASLWRNRMLERRAWRGKEGEADAAHEYRFTGVVGKLRATPTTGFPSLVQDWRPGDHAAGVLLCGARLPSRQAVPRAPEGVVMGKKLTPAQVRMLEAVRDHGSPTWGLRSMAEHGGARGTEAVLLRHVLIEYVPEDEQDTGGELTLRLIDPMRLTEAG